MLGIYHESNTFLPTPTTLSEFEKGHLLTGTDIINEYEDAHHELGGIIEVLRENGADIVPVIYAEATPGGMVSAGGYQALLTAAMKALELVLPVDGCIVVPHGAGVSEQFSDMDGHWLNELRKKVGNDVPIIGTLDPHANVSKLMIASTEALVAYKTNPHVDQRQTGIEAARLMVGLLKRKIRPEQVMVQLPLAISIDRQHTESEPCKSLYAYAQELLKQKEVLSISILLGFPYADVEEMGSSIIVVTDADPELAMLTARKLESYVLRRKQEFVGQRKTVQQSLAELKAYRTPILMLDIGDNIGGGSPGNSLVLLEALEQEDCRFFMCIYDPLAVNEAAKYSKGDEFELFIQDSNSKRFPVRASLINHVDGKFTESSPRHGGQVNFNMGQTAIVETEKGNVLMLTSLRTPPFSLQQLLAFNVNPENFDVIVAKGVNAPIAAYGPVCASVMQVDTPGITQADMTRFTYHKRRKPLFPFESV